MGGGHYDDKNDVTASTTADKLVSSNGQVDVGKKTKTGAVPSGPQTGIPMVDNPPACADHPTDGTDCFLTPERRGFAVSEFGDQVGRTGTSFGLAVSMVEVDVRLEKEEGPGFIASIFMSMLTGFLVGKIGDAIMSAKEAIKVDLGNTGWSGAAKSAADKVASPVSFGSVNPGPSLTQKALLAVENYDKAKMEMKIESIIDKAKEMPKKGMEKVEHAELQSKQQDSLNFLEVVRKQGEAAFNHIRQELLTGATDTEIVAYVHLFDLKDKMTTDFVDAVSGKLARYLKSDVNNIGRHTGIEVGERSNKREPIVGSKSKNTDVKVQWQRNISGYPFKDGQDKHLVFINQQAYGSSDTPSTGQVQKGTGVSGNRQSVDKEFWDVAAAKHKAMWGADPETEFIDDSNADDAKQALTAKTQKANIAKSQLMAEHAANVSRENMQAVEAQRRDAMKVKPLVDSSTMLDTD